MVIYKPGYPVSAYTPSCDWDRATIVSVGTKGCVVRWAEPRDFWPGEENWVPFRSIRSVKEGAQR